MCKADKTFDSPKKEYETILPVTKTWDYIIYFRSLWFSECGNINTSFARHFHLNIKEDN